MYRYYLWLLTRYAANRHWYEAQTQADVFPDFWTWLRVVTADPVPPEAQP